MQLRSPPGWGIALRAWSPAGCWSRLALVAVLAALIGLAFAGSPVRIANGVAIAGVDVGGLTKSRHRRCWSAASRRRTRAGRLHRRRQAYPIKATTLSVEADWASAIGPPRGRGRASAPSRLQAAAGPVLRLGNRAAGAGVRSGARLQAGRARPQDRPEACRGEARAARPERRSRARPAGPAARAGTRRRAGGSIARTARARPAGRAAGTASIRSR